MLTDAQFKQLERDLWTTTTHPHVYALMRDNLELRIECKALMTLVYRVLSHNYKNLEQNEKLNALEVKLTEMGDILE